MGPVEVIGCVFEGSTPLDSARRHGAKTLSLIADPNAQGFDEKFGARVVGQHQSSIPGRTIPMMAIDL